MIIEPIKSRGRTFYQLTGHDGKALAVCESHKLAEDLMNDIILASTQELHSPIERRKAARHSGFGEQA